MTEAEWSKCADPEAMLSQVGNTARDHKLRLFSCACCHRAWAVVRDERLGRVIDMLERYADGTTAERLRAEARKQSEAVRMELYDDVKRTKEVCVAAELSFAATKSLRRVARDCGKRAAQAAAWTDVGDFAARWQAERSNQTALLRDIFGNPFRPVAFSLDWRTSTATTLASQMYESRDFSAMPILADALQDAGCDSADVLNHCRRPGAHVRGCWVVDLVLGKE